MKRFVDTIYWLSVAVILLLLGSGTLRQLGVLSLSRTVVYAFYGLTGIDLILLLASLVIVQTHKEMFNNSEDSTDFDPNQN